ncbi:MAG: nucleotidyltransferase family protein [Clostridia bacterium]|nr:nucleotidyltransferase family protein [Clostridia bacterium]
MKCDSVVLAAGYSSRAGTDKMSLPIGDKTVLERVIETLYPVSDRIVVVGGFNYDETKKITDKYKKARLVKNENYELGMFSSVKRGVAEMSRDFFLMPGDYPAVRTSTCEKLMLGQGEMVVPVYKGRKGHPVLIRKELIAEIENEPVDSNLKVFRDRHVAGYVEVDDEGIILDVDTPEDYEHVKGKIGKGLI